MERQGEENSNHPRNGKIRAWSKSGIEYATKKLHDTFPDLTANQITYIGTAAVGIEAIHAALENSSKNSSFIRKIPILAGLSLASLSDAFDGSMARLIDREEGEKITDAPYWDKEIEPMPIEDLIEHIRLNPQDFSNIEVDLEEIQKNLNKRKNSGQIVDVVSDRTQEAFLVFSRLYSAYKRQDGMGMVLATLSGMTNVLPSLMRAAAESRGIVVEEDGRNLFELAGTRFGRAATGIAGTVFPESQKVTDVINIAANTMNAYGRVSKIMNAGEELIVLSAEERERALKRTNVLTGVAAATIILSAGAYVYLRGEK